MNLESLRFNFLLIYIDKVNVGQKKLFLFEEGKEKFKEIPEQSRTLQKKSTQLFNSV